MNASQIKQLLSSSLPGLQNRYPIASLALFGSVIREDYNEDSSDVDILVEFNGNIGIEFIDLADELEKLLGTKVDLVTRKGMKPRHWNYLKDRILYV